MKYQNLDYDIDRSQKFFVVRGTGLSTASGDSYLWWLNGTNRASQVSATTQKTITVDKAQQTLIAWDMTKSGLYDNFSGDRPSVCMGQTIFGLTSSNTNGSCEIHDINFVASIDDYTDEVTGIETVKSSAVRTSFYNLQGIPTKNPRRVFYIHNGKKYIK